jgi:hypothetical protein
MTQISVTLLNASDMPQHILKSAHLLSTLNEYSKSTQLMSFAGYLLMVFWSPQWLLHVLTDACFIRDKTAVLSTAITRRACRTVCDVTAPHMFRKFNGLLLILQKHLTWQGHWIIYYLIERSEIIITHCHIHIPFSHKYHLQLKLHHRMVQIIFKNK